MPHFAVRRIPTSAQLVGTWVTLPTSNPWLQSRGAAPLFQNTAACLSLMVYLQRDASIYQHWENRHYLDAVREKVLCYLEQLTNRQERLWRWLIQHEESQQLRSNCRSQQQYSPTVKPPHPGTPSQANRNK